MFLSAVCIYHMQMKVPVNAAHRGGYARAATQNLDLPIGLILVVVVLGREIAGQHMLSHLFKRRRKE